MQVSTKTYLVTSVSVAVADAMLRCSRSIQVLCRGIQLVSIGLQLHVSLL